MLSCKSGELIDAGADIARVGGKGALVLNVAVPERNLSKSEKGRPHCLLCRLLTENLQDR